MEFQEIPNQLRVRSQFLMCLPLKTIVYCQGNCNCILLIILMSQQKCMAGWTVRGHPLPLCSLTQIFIKDDDTYVIIFVLHKLITSKCKINNQYTQNIKSKFRKIQKISRFLMRLSIQEVFLNIVVFICQFESQRSQNIILINFTHKKGSQGFVRSKICIQNTKFKQYMNSHKILFLALFLAINILVKINAKCVNSTSFKYDLKEPSELVNYNSICSEFSKRTCCSNNNFQGLTKKIAKVMGGNVELSPACRHRLTSALCSWCDGDIGQNLKQGVCPNYCIQFYQECKNDYFSFDSNNQLKACKDQDIICSKLSDILQNKPKQGVCELLELSVAKNNCWSGEISAYLKGKGKNKVTIPVKNPKRRVKQPGIWDVIVQYKHIFGPLILATVVMAFFTIKRGLRMYGMWKRQIRNL